MGEEIPSSDGNNALVHYIEEGLVIDTRADESSAHHLVNIGGKGALLGFPATSRSTAAAPVTTLSTSRSEFVAHLQANPTDGERVMHEVARRTQVAHQLLHAAAPQGTSDHLLAILRVLDECLAAVDGKQCVFLPISLLELVCGCPWILIRPSVQELRLAGHIELSGTGVRLRQLI